MNIDFSGMSVLVCGSTQGIGKASAIEFAKNGADVVLIARDESKLKNLCEALPNNGKQQHRFLVADFSKPELLQQVIATYVQEGGNCHVLVNNSGGPKGGPILEAAVQEFTDTFSQHLICNHILAQALVPVMKQNKYGRIVNIISTSVKQALPNLGVSNTIRAAVGNWSKTLSNELAPFNITVNNVLPGATNTQRLQSIVEAKAQKTNLSVEEVYHEMASESPMGRIAEPEEVANAVVFLASPAASYINGINIPVDGGRTKSL